MVGVNYPNTAVEPYLAVNPKDSRNMVAVWQQDRWSSSGARGIVSAVSFDSGQTWSLNKAAFTGCSGGTSFSPATDPWVSFAPDGSAYQLALSFNEPAPVPDRAMQVARSSDGGRSWGVPIVLEHDTDPDLFMDKGSVTCDPQEAKLIYAVWDRPDHYTQQNSPLAHGPAYFTRSADGGSTWESPRIIEDPGADAQTDSNQVVLLPNGTLVDVLMIIEHISTQNRAYSVGVMRSTDKGVSWSPVIVVASVQFLALTDAKTGLAIRTGNTVPAIAVDASSGALYVAWVDARFSGSSAIAFSRSLDGGMTWSQPAQVNQSSATAFMPALTAAQGVVAATFIDLRNDNPKDTTHLIAPNWLSTSNNRAATCKTTLLTTPFALHTPPFP